MILRFLPLLLVSALFAALLASNYNLLIHTFTPQLAALLLHESFFPRLVISLLCGAGLALAGLLFQQVLQNPLAEPATLGVSAGANLAMSSALIFAPGLLVIGLPGLALLGSALMMLLLVVLVKGSRFAPLQVILAGMVLSLYGNALNTLLVLFNHDYLSDLFSWQAGSLNQSGWRSTQLLLATLVPLAAISTLLIRPLTVLGLSSSSASGLGIAVVRLQALTLAVAVALSALITSQVGLVGFIGLAAPALVKAAGVRRFSGQMALAPLTGALLLGLVDQVAQRLSPAAGDIPTGAVTALLSAPLLLMMLLRQRASQRAAPSPHVPTLAVWRPATGWLLLLLLALVMVGSLWLNRQPAGAHTAELLIFRWPRMLGALCAGAMLATAGVLIQRLTGNAMASPELLGISSCAALAVLLSVFFISSTASLFPAALTGSLGAIFTLFWFGKRSQFNASKLVLTGLCLTSLASALTMMLMLSGDPRALMLLNWSTGSTSGVTTSMAQSAVVTLVILFPLALLLQRWLTLLTLGQMTARSLGMALQRSHLIVLLLAAALTAAGTLLVGPLSFVGLIAPQLAWSLGARHLRLQLITAALVGALLMVLADWLGRNIAWPWPVSAGLLSAFIGAPWFLWRLRRHG
jgi:ABC-type Fe3+-siderophore transport system permease subunit